MKKYWWLYLAGIVTYIVASVLSMKFIISGGKELALFVLAYSLVGIPVFRRLIYNIENKQYFNENFLIILASAGAVGIGRYIEGTLIILLFAIVGIAEELTERHSKKIIKDFIDIQPEMATRKVRGKEFQVEPSKLKIGHIIVVKPGEKVPVDGEVLSGHTNLNMQALTGESLPQPAKAGSKIYAGSINLTGAIDVRVTKEYKESTVARIMQLVEDAGKESIRGKTNVGDFMKKYTPVVMVLGIVIATVPPTTFAWGEWNEWIYKALVFLVAACPCGLLASEPITFLGGIAAGARHGVIIKGGHYLDLMSKANVFIFDKTGTLTEGVFEITEVHPEDITEEELLRIAAHAESYSNHPVAVSLREAYGKEIETRSVRAVKELPGLGISAVVEGKRVHIGNRRMAKTQGVEYAYVESGGTVLHVIIDGKYAGYLVAEDKIREDAYSLMGWFRKHLTGVYVMLTGDRKAAAERVADELDLDYAYAGLMPKDKLEHLNDFMKLQADNEKVVYVGDGINDAMVLAKADIGIAMGALGSDVAIEAADIVLLEDDITKIIDVIKLSRESVSVVRGNIIIAVIIKIVVLGLAALGLIGMQEVLISDLVIMVVALLNAVSIAFYPVD